MNLDKYGRTLNLSAMITGLVLVFVFILVFAAFAGPISDAVNDTYVGVNGSATQTLWDALVFLLIVLSVILAIVFWALSGMKGGGRT